MKVITSFEEAEQYLNDMPRFTSKHTIEQTREYLEKMGSPDKKMKIIHVAGTNGKGSTSAYINSVLCEAGVKVGLFTSPHLVDICERFCVDGKVISHDTFLESFLRIYESLDWEALDSDEIGKYAYHPTYFEYLFFMAMDIFSRENVMWCILETGLGGLLDATNSVHEKEAAVITRIGLDHMEYLGDSISKIAEQKAGIISENGIVIYNDLVLEAAETIKRVATEKNATSFVISNATVLAKNTKTSQTIDFFMADGYYKSVLLSLQTIAEYQVQNAALAVKTIENTMLKTLISPEILKAGINKCFWSGRMEQVASDVYLDGAHNPDGIEAFIRTVRKDGYDGKRSLLFGVVSDKNYAEMIREIVEAGLFSHITVSPLHTSRSADVSELIKTFDAFTDVEIKVSKDTVSGLKDLLGRKLPDERIYITGSLYLVGEIKKYFDGL